MSPEEKLPCISHDHVTQASPKVDVSSGWISLIFGSSLQPRLTFLTASQRLKTSFVSLNPVPNLLHTLASQLLKNPPFLMEVNWLPFKFSSTHPLSTRACHSPPPGSATQSTHLPTGRCRSPLEPGSTLQAGRKEEAPVGPSMFAQRSVGGFNSWWSVGDICINFNPWYP